MLSLCITCVFIFFFSSRRRHTRLQGDWSSDVCSSDLTAEAVIKNLDPKFPSSRPNINRELAQLLIYLQASGVIERTLELASHATTQEIGRASCRERV